MSSEIVKSISATEIPIENGIKELKKNRTISSASAGSISGTNFSVVNGESESSPTKCYDSLTMLLKCYDRLIEELKCPGCAAPMRTPIRLCEDGHSICDLCSKRLPNCPLCKKVFTLTRSLTLEALSAKAQFCCSYASAGCKVRLPLDLLDWHEKQCKLKIIKCFMGKVWKNCDWMGREEMWPDHLTTKHMNNVYVINEMPIEMVWNIKDRLIPLAGFYVINWKTEIFNLYQIYDKQNSRVLWSMTIAGKLSKKRDKNITYAYEIEIYSNDDESKFICQRYPCHMEQDKDILQEGTCVTIPMTDISRFIVESDDEKYINYRIKIHAVKIPEKKLSISIDKKLPIDFQQTDIEGVNHKSVSPDVIVTRRTYDPDDTSLTTTVTPTSTPSMSPIKEKTDNAEDQIEEISDHKNGGGDDDSESEPELEAFVNDMMKKKWTRNLTTPNLTRKFWDDNYQYNESDTSLNALGGSGGGGDEDNELIDPQNHVIRLKKKNSIKSFRETFKNFRTDLSEKNYFGNNSKKSIKKK